MVFGILKSMQYEALESSLKKTGANIPFGQKVNSINFDDVNLKVSEFKNILLFTKQMI